MDDGVETAMKKMRVVVSKGPFQSAGQVIDAHAIFQGDVTAHVHLLDGRGAVGFFQLSRKRTVNDRNFSGAPAAALGAVTVDQNDWSHEIEAP